MLFIITALGATNGLKPQTPTSQLHLPSALSQQNCSLGGSFWACQSCPSPLYGSIWGLSL